MTILLFICSILFFAISSYFLIDLIRKIIEEHYYAMLEFLFFGITFTFAIVELVVAMKFMQIL